ncbi:ATPase P [bacterium]|nr:ATPase P [bacterium]
MIEVSVPGWQECRLEHLVCDFNGTLATDGVLAEGVAKRLGQLAERVTIHIVTADTHGTARDVFHNLPVSLTRLTPGGEREEKARLVEELGRQKTIFIGNGANDVDALRHAMVSIAVLGEEGAYSQAMQVAQLVVARPSDALDLMLTPKRLIAGLRR